LEVLLQLLHCSTVYGSSTSSFFLKSLIVIPLVCFQPQLSIPADLFLWYSL
jgi:hypothetical protein